MIIVEKLCLNLKTTPQTLVILQSITDQQCDEMDKYKTSFVKGFFEVLQESFTIIILQRRKEILLGIPEWYKDAFAVCWVQ